MFLAYNFFTYRRKKNGFYELSLIEDARACRVQTSKKKGKQDSEYFDFCYFVILWFGYLVKIDRRLIMRLEKEFEIV